MKEKEHAIVKRYILIIQILLLMVFFAYVVIAIIGDIGIVHTNTEISTMVIVFYLLFNVFLMLLNAHLEKK